MDKYILITGGFGFIGYHLIQSFIENYKIIVIDNLITGKNILKDDRIIFYNIDLCDNIDFLIQYSKNIDFVFHLASIASPKFYKKFPLETLDVGSIGTKNLFDIFLKHNKDVPILIASTSEVYGDPLITPQSEKYYGNVNCFGERSCYDESKRFMEALAYTYIQLGLDIKIARIFNTYGPFMDIDDGRVIPNFIKQCLNNEDITIYGDGTQTRSFCYIDDMINGLVKLINSNTNFPINIGNSSTEYTINEIANIINSKIGNKNNTINIELTNDDPLMRNPQIDLAMQYLKWKPTITIEYGIEKTISYFKKNFK